MPDRIGHSFRALTTIFNTAFFIILVIVVAILLLINGEAQNAHRHRSNNVSAPQDFEIGKPYFLRNELSEEVAEALK
jgi:uncharacterized membrane protein